LQSLSLFLSTRLVEDVSEMASAAVLAVEMSGHENAGAAFLVGALTAKTRDLAILVNLVVLEDRKLDLLSLVLDLLGGGEGLLLALLATSSQAEDEMEGRLLLDVVVGQSATILKLLASEDQTLLIGRDALFVLDFGFDIFDGIARLDLEGDGLPRERFDEDLHATSESENEMKSRLFLDVVVGKRASVFQLLAGEDEPLLIRRDTFLVLDLGFHVLNGIAGLDLQRDSFASEGLDENLHATPQTEDQVKSRFLLNVVIRKGSAIFELLAGENQPLLIGGNSFLILNLCLHIFDGIAWLNLQSDGYR